MPGGPRRAAPGQGVALLRDKFPPVPPMADERFRRLLADLDHDDFARREKAEAELARSAEAIEEPLRAALKQQRSAEVRRRIEHLLDGLKVRDGAPEQLRLARSLQVLEQIATPEARRLLKALGGGPEARRTREARVEK